MRRIRIPYIAIALLGMVLAGYSQKSSVPPDTQMGDAEIFAQIGRMSVQINALTQDKQKLIATIHQLDAKIEELQGKLDAGGKKP